MSCEELHPAEAGIWPFPAGFVENRSVLGIIGVLVGDKRAPSRLLSNLQEEASTDVGSFCMAVTYPLFLLSLLSG